MSAYKQLLALFTTAAIVFKLYFADITDVYYYVYKNDGQMDNGYHFCLISHSKLKDRTV